MRTKITHDCYYDKCYKKIWPWQKMHKEPRQISESMRDQFSGSRYWGLYTSTPITYHEKCWPHVKERIMIYEERMRQVGYDWRKYNEQYRDKPIP